LGVSPLADCTRGFIPKTLPIAYPKEFKVIKSNRPRVQKQNFAHPTLVKVGKIFSRKSTKNDGNSIYDLLFMIFYLLLLLNI
jgi:hypothetical protein